MIFNVPGDSGGSFVHRATKHESNGSNARNGSYVGPMAADGRLIGLIHSDSDSDPDPDERQVTSGYLSRYDLPKRFPETPIAIVAPERIFPDDGSLAARTETYRKVEETE